MMILDLNGLLLLGILSAAVHWTIARSKIGQPLWSRARGWFAALLACPACSGFWIGIGLAFAGVSALHGPISYPVEIIANGLLALFATPIVEGLLLWGLATSAIVEDHGSLSSAPLSSSSDTEAP